MWRAPPRAYRGKEPMSDSEHPPDRGGEPEPTEPPKRAFEQYAEASGWTPPGDEPAPVNLTLFGGTPRDAYRRMNETVEVMKEAFQAHAAIFTKPIVFNEGKQNERTQIHVTAEGWTFVGGLVGVTARTKWTEYLTGEFEEQVWVDDPSGAVWEDSQRPKKVKSSEVVHTHGYKAMVEAVTMTGAVVGASEGLCLAAEGRWGDADEYARKSMAQTRAKSQAIAGVLRFLVEMAGYKGTPAEEMSGVEDRTAAQQTERRVEGSRPAIIRGWNELMEKLDYVSGFTGGVSKGLLQSAAEELWGKKIERFGDLPREETMRRLHGIWWSLERGAGTLGVAPTDLIAEKWAEFWPEVNSVKMAATIHAAADDSEKGPPAETDIDLDDTTQTGDAQEPTPGEYP